MTDAPLVIPGVSASDTIRTIGILHFTIGVRDHIAAAKFYSEVVGCRHLRSNERYSFMECGGSYFVLAKIPHHVNPNCSAHRSVSSWPSSLWVTGDLVPGVKNRSGARANAAFVSG